ncbi:hypothetical protein GGR52DRAFT_78696 [Hypoxylon sp. FL1284]|nr:hypothetical protein GGR52DRAFT_78696 [Hypoxylon sp. FL1284]
MLFSTFVPNFKSCFQTRTPSSSSPSSLPSPINHTYISVDGDTYYRRFAAESDCSRGLSWSTCLCVLEGVLTLSCFLLPSPPFFAPLYSHSTFTSPHPPAPLSYPLLSYPSSHRHKRATVDPFWTIDLTEQVFLQTDQTVTDYCLIRFADPVEAVVWFVFMQLAVAADDKAIRCAAIASTGTHTHIRTQHRIPDFSPALFFLLLPFPLLDFWLPLSRRSRPNPVVVLPVSVRACLRRYQASADVPRM